MTCPGQIDREDAGSLAGRFPLRTRVMSQDIGDRVNPQVHPVSRERGSGTSGVHVVGATIVAGGRVMFQ